MTLKVMRTIGLTGGIASGKSSAIKWFKELQPSCVIFDADACVKKLYTLPEVQASLVDIFGEKLLINEEVDKLLMREAIFHDFDKKSKVEKLIHPLVRKECLALLSEAQHCGVADIFVAEIPLLFENEFHFGQDLNLVVAVSKHTQIKRLKLRNGYDDATVHAILEAQLPLDRKIDLADVVLWNNGLPEMLKLQIQCFLNE